MTATQAQAQQTLVLATRGSPLAVSQSQWVADQVEQALPGVRVELSTITTQGDVILDRPLREVGGKGLFTKGVELALLEGAADLAVHSLKDMDSVGPDGLEIIAFPKREDPRDVVVTMDGSSLAAMDQDARIGTGGLRRVAQLRGVSPHFQLLPLRGNINSRLEKLAAGQFDAIMLAAAGLKRGGFEGRIGNGAIAVDQIVPAPGQGILAVQMPTDHPLKSVVADALNDLTTQCQAAAERAFLSHIGGNCHSPIGAYCAYVAGQEQAEMTVYLAPTLLGENKPLDSFSILEQTWRCTLSFLPQAGIEAFVSAGQQLAEQAKREAPHILRDWDQQ